MMSLGEPVALPLRHIFTDGLYAREITMPKGAMLSSLIHKTQHPYVISKGKVKVFDGDKTIILEAPYLGVTEPNTRRALLILEETIWTTFHVTEKTDVDEIKKDIIQEYENPLLDQEKLKERHDISVSEFEIINKRKILKEGGN